MTPSHFKGCGKCGQEKPASSFHKRAASIDGLSACCKPCQQLYDRARLHKPDRVAFRLQYRTTEQGKSALMAGGKRWIERNPIKRKAHIAVNNAVRAGRLKRAPCAVCGNEKAHAHHDDYTKPLEVRWLCTTHHAEVHMKEICT